VNSQFFGAHTLQIKIARDWATLPEENITALRDELFNWIVHYCTGPPFLLTKLCVALASLALHAAPVHWPNFINWVINEVQERYTTISDRALQMALTSALEEFLTVVPEEVSRADLVASKRAKLQEELNNATDRVVDLLQQFLSIPSTADAGDPVRCLKLGALKCAQSWIQYGVPFNSLRPLIDQVISLLSHRSTFEPAASVLVELVSSPSAAAFEETMCNGLLRVLTGNWAKEEYARAITGMTPIFTLCP